MKECEELEILCSKLRKPDNWIGYHLQFIPCVEKQIVHRLVHIEKTAAVFLHICSCCEIYRTYGRSLKPIKVGLEEGIC